MKLPIRALQPISLHIDGAWYPSLVLDFNEGLTLLVGVPQHHGSEVVVENDTPLTVAIPLPDGMRRFETKVLRRMVTAAPGLVLAWPADVERIQRRDYYRVDVELRAEVSYTEAATGQHRITPGWSIDLSGGGVRLAMPEPIEADTRLKLRISLSGSDTLMCDARVIRWGERTGEPAARQFWVACEFVDPSEAFRKEVMKVVFDIQREQMRRG